LGETLLSSGAITSFQLEQALDEQRATGLLLGETLVALEFISEEALGRVLAEQAGVAFAMMADAWPDRAAAALVPEPFARKHLLAPVELKGSVLQVVQANPFDVLALDDLRQATARPVSAICAPPDDVRLLLDRCYSSVHDERGDRAQASLGAGTAVADTVGSTASTAASEPNAHQLLRLSELGFSRRDLALVLELSNAPRGLVVVTGLDRAGKRIVHAMLTQLADASKNIVTIEDTIESRIPGVRQTQIIPSTGLTYAVALRSMLRQYPDVIMVEDVQDPEAAEMALRAAQSGVLVLTTLNEGDATSAVARLVDMRLEPYLLASCLTGVIAQRLIRLICADCREPVTYPADVLAKVGLEPDPGVVLARGRGCVQCGGTGYRGHTGTYEILVVDSALRALIRERADVRAIARAAGDSGMRTLCEDALAKAILQQTTLEEVVAD
jgi:type II secretory ATPase GspE/PulE/Tfp pilus assembly ATPase PilB-like protein